jgi:hypothetical protein
VIINELSSAQARRHDGDAENEEQIDKYGAKKRGEDNSQMSFSQHESISLDQSHIGVVLQSRLVSYVHQSQRHLQYYKLNQITKCNVDQRSKSNTQVMSDVFSRKCQQIRQGNNSDSIQSEYYSVVLDAGNMRHDAKRHKDEQKRQPCSRKDVLNR